MNSIDLIIYDCDGVLVDSERITAEVFAKVLEEECGLSFEFEVLLDTFMGQTSQSCLNIIEGMLGHKPPAGLEALYQNKISSALQKSVTAIVGIEPDVFLYAAEKMNCLNPSRCLVIEDSPLGVQGGVSAGMTVFGYADLIHKQKLIDSGAHHIFTEMGNLANEIAIYDQISNR